MPTSETLAWPVCPACGAPLTVTIGQPITLQAINRGLVEIELDLGDVADLDDSAHVGCCCSSEPERTDEQIEQLVAALTETSERAKVNGALAYVHRGDL